MKFLVLSLLLNASLVNAAQPWLIKEVPFATQKILASTVAAGAAPGAVIASPSKENPNYYFHWIRDAALTMDTVVSLWQNTTDKNKRELYHQRILAYLRFSRKNQESHTLSDLGEPKFNINGTPFTGAWGRPQNDGPALRAITAIHYAQELLRTGQDESFVTELYDRRLPTNSLIKTDLEYVSHHWQDASFDLWEETLGDHFYTRMVQRKALLLGATLADQLKDPGAASWYRQQAHAIESSLQNFWDPKRGYIVATRNRRGGVDYKNSGLDVAVILGALHGGMGDGFFDAKDPRVRHTLDALVQQFSSSYDINHQGYPATALGRYPEDTYAGTNFSGGNPWVLATLAAGEFYYRLAGARSCGDTVKSGLLAIGDTYVARVGIHANPNGSLSEQIDRKTGFMISAVDLTWNYASVLTTSAARNAAQSCGKIR